MTAIAPPLSASPARHARLAMEDAVGTVAPGRPGQDFRRACDACVARRRPEFRGG